MAERLSAASEPTNVKVDTGRSGSRSKPPKAVSRSDSLDPLRPVSDHDKSKRRLTEKTVAFSALLTLWLSMTQAVGLACRPTCSRHRVYKAWWIRPIVPS